MNATDMTGCVNNTIIVRSGRYFDFADPQLDQFEIDDIATALGNTCRFGGHCDFYSVAEHCVLAAGYVQEVMPWNVGLRKHVLLHDAAEAFIGDMTKPLKVMMPEYRAIESRIEKVIELKFGLLSPSYKKDVKRIDLMMLKAEKRQLFPSDQLTWSGFDDIEDIDVQVRCWSPNEAAEEFNTFFRKIERMEERT